jgi:hypothetical protein
MTAEELQTILSEQGFGFDQKQELIIYNGEPLNKHYVNDYFKNCHNEQQFRKRLSELLIDVRRNPNLWT